MAKQVETGNRCPSVISHPIPVGGLNPIHAFTVAEQHSSVVWTCGIHEGASAACSRIGNLGSLVRVSISRITVHRISIIDVQLIAADPGLSAAAQRLIRIDLARVVLYRFQHLAGLGIQRIHRGQWNHFHQVSCPL
ncbi:hypothetical protein D3C75_743780 [compost metagenome]